VKPTEVQIISIKGYENHLKSNESHVIEKNEVFASEDTVGDKKYTIRADRVYQAECRSKGSRPLATIEWYLLKKNQRFNVGQSINSTRTMDASSLMILLGEKRGGANLEDTISGVVETQQVSNKFLIFTIIIQWNELLYKKQNIYIGLKCSIECLMYIYGQPVCKIIRGEEFTKKKCKDRYINYQ